MMGSVFFACTASIFRTLDVDGSGDISFAETLRVLFPQASEKDIRRMCSYVDNPPVKKEDVEHMKDIFEDLDKDVQGRVQLQKLLNSLAMLTDERFALWLERRSYRYKESSLVTLRQLLIELFSKSQHDHMTQILEWAPSIFTFTPEQQKQMIELFQLYDADGDGFITKSELKARVKKLAFSDKDVDDIFHLFDTNGDDVVNVSEFKAFYRSVWNTPQNYDIYAFHTPFHP